MKLKFFFKCAFNKFIIYIHGRRKLKKILSNFGINYTFEKIIFFLL